MAWKVGRRRVERYWVFFCIYSSDSIRPSTSTYNDNTDQKQPITLKQNTVNATNVKYPTLILDLQSAELLNASKPNPRALADAAALSRSCMCVRVSYCVSTYPLQSTSRTLFLRVIPCVSWTLGVVPRLTCRVGGPVVSADGWDSVPDDDGQVAAAAGGGGDGGGGGGEHLGDLPQLSSRPPGPAQSGRPSQVSARHWRHLRNGGRDHAASLSSPVPTCCAAIASSAESPRQNCLRRYTGWLSLSLTVAVRWPHWSSYKSGLQLQTWPWTWTYLIKTLGERLELSVSSRVARTQS